MLSPQEAFYSEREKSLTLDESVGQVCGEFVMCAILQESLSWLLVRRIIREIVDCIQFAKERGCSLKDGRSRGQSHQRHKRKEN